MAAPFDPYHTWLGISPKDQPPHHYRLLGIDPFESEPTVISNAADQRMAHVRGFQAGQNSNVSQRILNEIAAARVCLLDVGKKSAYDAALRARLACAVLPVASIRAQPIAAVVPVALAAAGPAFSTADQARPKKKSQPSSVVLIAGGVAATLLAGGIVAAVCFVVGHSSKEKSSDSGSSVGKPVGPVAKTSRSDTVELPTRGRPGPSVGNSPKRATPPTPSTVGGSITKAASAGPKTTSSKSGSSRPVTSSAPTDPIKPPRSGIKSAPAEPRTVLAASTDSGSKVREVAPPTAAVRPAAKAPVPSEEEQARATRTAKEVYADQYAKAKGTTEKRALAQAMLNKAAQETDVAAHYVLLNIAKGIATSISDSGIALQAVDQMNTAFVIESVKMKADVLLKIAGQEQADRKPIAEEALAVADDAVTAEQFELAARLVQTALAEAQRTHNSTLTLRSQKRSNEIVELTRSYDDVQDALETLKRHPADAEANLAVGKYRCFQRGNWHAGLPLLKLGSDPGLKEVAAKDIYGAATTAKQVDLGDAWWSIASTERGIARQNIQKRAAMWYRQAQPSTDGLVQEKIDKRLQSLSGSPATPRPAVTASTPPSPTVVRNSPIRAAPTVGQHRRQGATAGFLTVWEGSYGQFIEVRSQRNGMRGIVILKAHGFAKAERARDKLDTVGQQVLDDIRDNLENSSGGSMIVQTPQDTEGPKLIVRSVELRFTRR